MIDLEDSSTWERDPDGRMICPGCGALGSRVPQSTFQMILHPPGCTLSAWEDED
jgi:hypothetical protein